MRRFALAAAVTLTMSVAGCGDSGGEQAVDPEGSSRPADGRVDDVTYRGSGTVLENPGHGPQLCGVVATSHPPQCSGVPLIGWDWTAVDGEESAIGTTWGTWEVTGTWDGAALTLTQPPDAPRQQRDDGRSAFTTPCPTPAGGWAPVDPSLVSFEAQEAAMRVAEQLPDLAGTWVDQSINPALADGVDPGDEFVANDPALLVINVRVTEDLPRAEDAIREVWGGALCVSSAERTMAELRAIQDQLIDDPGAGPSGLSSVATDGTQNRVLVTMHVATPDIVEDLEDRFGDAVAVTGLLEPVD